MGITEPTLYGVNLPKKYPLIAAMIGGGAGGLYAGLTNTHRFATGSSGLPAILLYIGDNSMAFFWNIMIALIISAVVSAVLTYVLSFKFEKEVTVPSVKEIILEDTIIANPIKGNVMSLSEVQDGAFASEALGKGFAIEPIEGKVIAPFNGKIEAIFPTKHAIGLVSDTGIELLIHVGLNTVELKGQYFDTLVESGQTVKKGQVILNFDLEKIREAGYETQVPVVITNTPQYSSIELTTKGQLANNEEVLIVKV
ncbi:PTS system beta-glucosides-specific IIC component [Enterococcus rotai]